MGTIFVAYGEPDTRESVLEFAARRAAASGDDLYVFHALESHDESEAQLRDEVELVIQRTAPEVDFEVGIPTREEVTDATNVSTQRQLLDAIFDGDRKYEYVVMGNLERGPIEQFTLASTTQAVLEAHEIPVLLVPV